MARVKKRPRLTRDTVLLISGLLAAIYEIGFAAKVEPSVLLLITGWTMSPLALRIDEAIGKARTKTGDAK